MPFQDRIITYIENRQEFLSLLQNSPGLTIVKFGATWCGPCKKIENDVVQFFETSPDNIVCAILDADESFDLYSCLKSKKMVNGIPVLLCYKKGNVSYIPDDSVTGSDKTALVQFFRRCVQYSRLV
jgi:thiol-disulfide isomerase/thioredoxin